MNVHISCSSFITYQNQMILCTRISPGKTWLSLTEGKNQALVGALPFCGEYPGPRSEDKFRSSNQMDGISIADGGKMADS